MGGLEFSRVGPALGGCQAGIRKGMERRDAACLTDHEWMELGKIEGVDRRRQGLRCNRVR